MKNIIKYKRDFDYSYTSGAFTTIELLKTRPELVETVYLHSRVSSPVEIEELCEQNGIKTEYNDKVFRRTNQKESTYVLGVFRKYSSSVSLSRPHVVLVNPSDMGNLGTIIRTLAGFDLRNLAIITPAADIWDPKTLRASMGALFHVKFQHFNSIGEYMEQFPNHTLYPFMPGGEIELRPDKITRNKCFSLVFGNEAKGLDDDFRKLGTSIRIPQTELVDSLNLSIAVAVGIYIFMLK